MSKPAQRERRGGEENRKDYSDVTNAPKKIIRREKSDNYEDITGAKKKVFIRDVEKNYSDVNHAPKRELFKGGRQAREIEGAKPK